MSALSRLFGGPGCIGRHSPRWLAYWHFVGFAEISLGVNVDVWSPNLSIHLPFGFLFIGRRWYYHVDREWLVGR